jgi:hypothetical protein
VASVLAWQICFQQFWLIGVVEDYEPLLLRFQPEQDGLPYRLLLWIVLFG